MKPHRVRMAHSLVLHYGLYSKLDGVRQLSWQGTARLQSATVVGRLQRSPCSAARPVLSFSKSGGFRCIRRCASMALRGGGSLELAAVLVAGPPLLRPSSPDSPLRACRTHPCRLRRVHGTGFLVCCHACVLQYYTPTRASAEDLAAFHSQDYVDFLKTITPDNLVNTACCPLALVSLLPGWLPGTWGGRPRASAALLCCVLLATPLCGCFLPGPSVW